MRKTAPFILIACLVIPCFAAEEVAALFRFKTYGFSISPLEETSDVPAHVAVTMFLPPSESFAPNVNVLIQRDPGTVAKHVEATKKQLEALKFTMLSEKVEERVYRFEYTGNLQGAKLHYYGKSEFARGKVYVVTGTAKDSQWEAVGDKLKKCVDSFKVD